MMSCVHARHAARANFFSDLADAEDTMRIELPQDVTPALGVLSSRREQPVMLVSASAVECASHADQNTVNCFWTAGDGRTLA